MQRIYVFLFVLIFPLLDLQAQIKMDARDMNNLVAMSQVYSLNSIKRNPGFVKSIDSLRTPLLNTLADAMLMMYKGDASIFSSRFFKRPANFEMTLWYVVREIHYNRTSKTRKPRPDMDVARETIVRTVDDRCLVDNYYYRILGGTNSLLNTTDLSTMDIKLDELGLLSDAEKAIVFLVTIEALVGGRPIPLLKANAWNSILGYSEKLPMFNGRYYFYFKGFQFDDFECQGFEHQESYFQRHLDKLFNVLVAHYNASQSVEYQHEMYYNSMMSEANYFRYATLQTDLQAIYDNANK